MGFFGPVYEENLSHTGDDGGVWVVLQADHQSMVLQRIAKNRLSCRTGDQYREVSGILFFRRCWEFGNIDI